MKERMNEFKKERKKGRKGEKKEGKSRRQMDLERGWGGLMFGCCCV